MAPRLGHNPPMNIRYISEINIFKSKLKTHVSIQANNLLFLIRSSSFNICIY